MALSVYVVPQTPVYAAENDAIGTYAANVPLAVETEWQIHYAYAPNGESMILRAQVYGTITYNSSGAVTQYNLRYRYEAYESTNFYIGDITSSQSFVKNGNGVKGTLTISYDVVRKSDGATVKNDQTVTFSKNF